MNKDMLLSLFMQTWYSFKGSMLAGFHVKNLRLRVIGFTKKQNRHYLNVFAIFYVCSFLTAMERKQKRKLNIKQRFSCGVGSVLNEIFRQMFISFTIIFFMQVIRLPASQAGLALLIGQVSDAILSPVTGYLGDRVQIPVVSKKIGRRKSWHLVGTIMMACGTPLLFNRCLVCTDFPDISWLPAVYYICIVVVVCMSYNIVEINHLSITYSAADTIQEGTVLNAIR